MIRNLCISVWQAWTQLPWGGWLPPEPRELDRSNR